jgi:hypothetical protein
MTPIKLEVVTNLKDVPGFPSVRAVCGVAVAKLITAMLKDIRDPKTGESPRIEFDADSLGRGIMMTLHGSDSVRAEAEIRISAMTKPTSASDAESL